MVVQTGARRLHEVVDRLQSAQRLCPCNQKLILLIDKASKARELLLQCTTLTSRASCVMEEWESTDKFGEAPLRNINDTHHLCQCAFTFYFVAEANLVTSITPFDERYFYKKSVAFYYFSLKRQFFSLVYVIIVFNFFNILCYMTSTQNVSTYLDSDETLFKDTYENKQDKILC